MVVHLAQLTDTHVVVEDTDEVLYVDNNDRARRVVAAIGAQRPAVDAVLATGDLTQWGAAEEFDVLRDVLAPFDVPVLAVPGNHDERDGLRRCFPDLDWVDAAHASWVHEIGGVRIVGLDSTVPGAPGADFDAERERWLTDVLAVGHDGPTVLAMHHPPFRSGIAWMDANGFVGRDRFAAVLDAADGAVDRIVCGHLHRPAAAVVGGVMAEVGPATTVHVALDLTGSTDVRLVRDPFGYRLLRIDGESIVSHVRYVDTGEQPFEPAWAADG